MKFVDELWGTVARPRSTRAVRARARADGVLAVTGCALAFGGFGWEFYIRALVGGHRSIMPLGFASATLAYQIGRWLTYRNRSAAAGAIVGLMAGYAITRSHVLYGRPYPAPLGYSNAAGSLFMVGAGSALFLVGRARRRLSRIIGIVAAAGFATVPLLNHTATASILVALLPLSLTAGNPHKVRAVIIASALAFAVSLTAAVALALTYSPDSRHTLLHPFLEATISERRVLLWREAVQTIVRHPLTGLGPSGFGLKSSFRMWPHNEVLHTGADTGLVGSALLLGLFAWGFARLWRGTSDRGTAVAAALLGAVGVHSNVDYVLHFPAVGMATAALVAAGCGCQRTSGAATTGE